MGWRNGIWSMIYWGMGYDVMGMRLTCSDWMFRGADYCMWSPGGLLERERREGNEGYEGEGGGGVESEGNEGNINKRHTVFMYRGSESRRERGREGKHCLWGKEGEGEEEGEGGKEEGGEGERGERGRGREGEKGERFCDSHKGVPERCLIYCQ